MPPRIAYSERLGAAVLEAAGAATLLGELGALVGREVGVGGVGYTTSVRTATQVVLVDEAVDQLLDVVAARDVAEVLVGAVAGRLDVERAGADDPVEHRLLEAHVGDL